MITHVQTATPVSNVSSATSGPTITLNGVVAGNEIVVWGTWGTSNTTPTCADDKLNAYAPSNKQFDGTIHQGLIGFTAKVTTGGTVVITVSWGGSADFRTVFASEYTGVDPVNDVDATSVGNLQATPGTGADGVSSTAFTTVTDNVMIVDAAVNIVNSSLPTVGSVGTLRSSDNTGAAMIAEEWAAGSAGSKTSNFTATSDVTHLSVQMALRPTVVTVGGPVLWAQGML